MLRYLFFIFLTFSLLNSQNYYKSTEQIETEWGSYTKSQRDEMISFCDFLFSEGYYERCLISSFQFLYKFPKDPTRPALLYLIARSYGEMQNYSLSRKYYQRVMDIEPENSIAYKASEYRFILSFLKEGKLNEVYSLTENTLDPYFLILRGYSYFQDLDWENARATFISAEERFNNKHYSKLMIPLYQSIDDVSQVKQHSKLKVTLSGLIFPGGGQLVMKDKQNAQGIFASSFLLFGMYSLGSGKSNAGNIRFHNSPGIMVPTYKGVNLDFDLSEGKLSENVVTKSALLKYTTPPIIFGSLLYLSSLIKSFFDIREKNKNIIYHYAISCIKTNPIEKFMDFEEPSIINNGYK